MALTNLRVRLAKPIVHNCVAMGLMVGNCVTEKQTQSMRQLLNLVCAVCTWKSGRLDQIVDVPVPQIDQEHEANQWVPQERTQQHINEPNFMEWNSMRNLYSEKMLQA